MCIVSIEELFASACATVGEFRFGTGQYVSEKLRRGKFVARVLLLRADFHGWSHSSRVEFQRVFIIFVILS